MLPLTVEGQGGAPGGRLWVLGDESEDEAEAEEMQGVPHRSAWASEMKAPRGGSGRGAKKGRLWRGAARLEGRSELVASREGGFMGPRRRWAERDLGGQSRGQGWRAGAAEGTPAGSWFGAGNPAGLRGFGT